MNKSEIKEQILSNGTYDKVHIDKEGWITARIVDTNHYEALGNIKYME